jgi:transposase-like protein
MGLRSPVVGVHYPGNLAALRSWFPDDAACLDYLDWLRWPDGFRCTHCGSEKGWRLPAGGWSCGGCRKRVRVLAGTVFQDTRTPLTVWFEAAWLMAVTKNGVSAASLQPLLGLGSYETAWAMCHKLRTAMGRTSVDLLSGDIEVDETYIGGFKTGGKRGRGAPGKVYVVIAVESEDKAFGRCRLQVVDKIDAVHLGEFLHRHIAPGSVVISDALRSYPLAIADTYGHKPFNIKRSGLHAHEVLPGVHRVASLLKRWLAGTHQSGVSAEHMQAYLDEFTFRFNRRHSRARGLLFFRLLEGAVTAAPTTMRELIKVPNPHPVPTPPPTRPVWPESLTAEPLDRPWRDTYPSGLLP